MKLPLQVIQVGVNRKQNHACSFSLYILDVHLFGNQAKVVTVKGKTNIQYSYNFTNNWVFVIVQAHTQYRNISLSTQFSDETYGGTDTAILRLMSYKSGTFDGVGTGTYSLQYVVQSFNGGSLRSLVAASTYVGKCK